MEQLSERIRRIISERDPLQSADSDTLRRFAAWCARLTNPESEGPRRLLDRLEAPLDTGDSPDMERLRAEFGSAAVAAATVGLMHRAPSASAFLAAFAAAHPDAVEAAVQASEHAERWQGDFIAAALEARLRPSNA